jgi:two-component system, LytTR family, response regulator
MADLIRTVIVDDEPAARRGVRGLLEADAEIDIVGEAGNGAEAVRLINELRPDLVFLDVQMPELNGFDVIEQVGVDHMPVIVFVTAHDAFALRAFEVQALDYLLKPFDDARFGTVLARAQQQVRARRAGTRDERLEALLSQYTGRAPAGISRIMVRNAGVVFFQPVDEIDWIEAADYFVKLHAGGKIHLVSETLGNLEQRLDPGMFMRVHRSAIVNLMRVRELRLDYQNRHVIVLANGERVPLSRSRREALEAALAGTPGSG